MAASVVPATLVGVTWQVRLASPAARAAFEGNEGWTAVFQARPRTAITTFVQAKDAAGQARLHIEYAAMYRQAALLASRAAIQVWGVDHQDTDPPEVAWLVGVAGVFAGVGDLDAGTRAALLAPVAGAPATPAAAWKTWVEAGAQWPPEGPAANAPGAPGATASAPLLAGGLPDGGPVPPWQFAERTPEALKIDAADPTTLWALSRWHEQAALAGPPDIAAAIPALLDPWRLPVEHAPARPASPVPASVPDTLWFLSPWTTPGDLALVAALTAGDTAAVAAYTKDSPYATILARCLAAGSGGKLQNTGVDCILEQAKLLGDDIQAAMAGAGGGVEGFHRPFADLARLGVMIAGERLALALHDDTARGQLWLNALDRANGPARSPTFLLSLAAWDVGNRYTLRAEDLLHELSPEVPGLDIARYPLDSLHIRLSRNAAPSQPMH